MKGENWREDAECYTPLPPRVTEEMLKSDPTVLRAREVMDLFFGADEASQQKAIDKYCGQCAVRQECLDYAIIHNEKSGVWGGMMYEQRKSLVEMLVEIQEAS